MPAHGRHDVRLVEVQARAITSPSASVDDVAEPSEALDGGSLSQPPSAVSQRGVVKWWKVTTGSTPRSRKPEALASVVVQGGPGDLALGRLDPAPLDREPVVVQAEPRHQIGILLPAVPGVAGVARRFRAAGARRVLEVPPVVVGVAPLDLVGRRRRAPGESRRERAVPVLSRPSALLPLVFGFPAARYRSLTMTSHSSPMTDAPDSEREGTGRAPAARCPRRWSRPTGS